VKSIDQGIAAEGTRTVEAWIIIKDILVKAFVVDDIGLKVASIEENTDLMGAFIKVVNLEVPFIIKDIGLKVASIEEGTDLVGAFVELVTLEVPFIIKNTSFVVGKIREDINFKVA
jgi:hypothetical protein